MLTLYLFRVLGINWLNVIFFDSAVALACSVRGATRGMRGGFGRILDARPLQYLGKISYGAYVYHVFLPAMILAILPWLCDRLGVENPGPGPLVFGLIAIAIPVVPVLSWHFFEQPINRLGVRFRESPRHGCGEEVCVEAPRVRPFAPVGVTTGQIEFVGVEISPRSGGVS